ncbi:MAG: transketolase [Bacteroidales bacterium]|nr:transketolase [Bacteroidales bacterium]MBO5818905.1 transketolase [Bacteroidales bacterium]MBO5835212.1 transketolase [Bacteroidales bacterium]MBO5847403.1 transketolase [Bacteroidales bacterium]MBO5916604.1 transketolase [Bacteroidales bacterium]
MSVIDQKKLQALQLLAAQIRKREIEIIYKARAGHTGGSLSSTDMLTALYFHVMNIDPKQPNMPDRDRFIMSKGHSVESLYCVLAKAGFFEDAWLETFSCYQSKLAGHPTRKVPGVEMNTGALGHGLPAGVGMAIAAKMDKKDYYTFVMMGDGEQGEGSIYEAAMAGSHYKLDNLVAIIDRNHLQISGNTEDVMSLEPMRERWEAFGWNVYEIDGNDMKAILETYEDIKQKKGKPHLIISHTIKGKGVSYMENVAKWHHGVPTDEEYAIAMKELDQAIETIKNA